MTPSHRRPSVEIFSMLFGIVYLTCFYMDWAPFRYYPDPRRFHLKITPQDGPAILWYGWVTAAAVVSAAIAAAGAASIWLNGCGRVGPGPFRCSSSSCC